MTIFCSAVCSTAGVCRKARLQGFRDCCHTGCFLWLLFAWDNFGYFLLPDRRAGSGQPATKLARSLEGRASGKGLCWRGHAGNSPEVCSVTVPTHLQCCPRARTSRGSCCHGHPDQLHQGEGAPWKRYDTLKGLLCYQYHTASFKNWILPTATSHFFLFVMQS